MNFDALFADMTANQPEMLEAARILTEVAVNRDFDDECRCERCAA